MFDRTMKCVHEQTKLMRYTGPFHSLALYWHSISMPVSVGVQWDSKGNVSTYVTSVAVPRDHFLFEPEGIQWYSRTQITKDLYFLSYSCYFPEIDDIEGKKKIR